MTPFRITPSPVGVGTVEIDGRPVAGVRSVAVKAEAGEATKVYVELTGEGTIEGEGIVHVVTPGSRSAVADFLAAIDPDELEKAALDRMRGFGGGSTGAAMLDVLRGWAGGGA